MRRHETDRERARDAGAACRAETSSAAGSGTTVPRHGPRPLPAWPVNINRYGRDLLDERSARRGAAVDHVVVRVEQAFDPRRMRPGLGNILVVGELTEAARSVLTRG